MVIFFFFPHKSMTDTQVQHKGTKGCILLQYADIYRVMCWNFCAHIAENIWKTWLASRPLGQQELLNLATR